MKAGSLEIELITNVARLQKEMRDVQRAVGGTMDDISRTTRTASDNLGKIGSGMGKASGTAKLAAHQVQNLTFQLNDMFVGLASGQKPMTVFVQQGVQIGQIAQQAGLGIAGMARAMVGLAGAATVAIITNPVLLGIAAAAATAYGAFKLFQSSVASTGELDRYRDSLGLTKKELEELGPVGITFGDVVKGVWKTISDGLGLEAIFTSIKDWMVDAFKTGLGWAKTGAAGIYGAFNGAYTGIVAVWKNFPALIGEATVGAVNLGIAALEKFLNVSIAGLNWLVGQINKIPLIGASGLTIPKINPISLDRMANNFTGAGAKVGGAFADGFNKGMGDALGAMDSLGQTLSNNIVGAAKSRMKKGADALKSDRTDKATGNAGSTRQAKEQVDELAKSLETAQDNIIKLSNELLKTDPFKDYFKDHLSYLEADKQAYEELERIRTGEMEAFTSQLDAVSRQVDISAAMMRDAFGSVGGAIGSVMTVLDQYGAMQAEIDKKAQLGIITQETARKQSAQNQIQGYGALAGAAKGLFKEHSSGYKVMASAEKAFALVQLANTAVSVAAGAGKMFAMLGPFAFPAVAAMLGVMASLGHKGGSGGASASYKAEDVQKVQGTGTVLGDSSAQSTSLSRSLDIMSKNSGTQLEYSNAMVRSLRAIETNIGALSSLLARQLGVSGGAFDQSKLGLGSNTSLNGIANGALGIIRQLPVIGGLFTGIAKALFGTKVTRTLVDQGIKFYSDTLGEIMAGGIEGSTYQLVQIKKKKKLFGISAGTKTTTQEYTNEIDNSVQDQASLLLTNIYDSITHAAQTIGIPGVDDLLKGFAVDLGKISLQGLKGSEIQEAISAVFSKAADDMAGYAVSGLGQFQKVGEGMYETLVRLAKDYQTIDIEMQSIGRSFGAVGASSVEAREALIDLFGSLDNFVDQTNYYRSNFLTEAEQIAPVMQSVNDRLSDLGLAWVSTIDQFKAVVNGLDLTTGAGQSLYASLLSLAPGFKAVEDYQTKQAQAAADAASEMAKAVADAAARFQGFADDLRAFRDELSGGGTTGVQTYRQAMTKLMSVGALASVGDEKSLGNLAGVSRDFLAQSKDMATSYTQYQRDVALVTGYLNSAIAVADGGAGVSSSGIAQVTGTPQQIVSTAGQVNADLINEVRGLRSEVAALRSESRAANESIAPAVNKSARLHERWDRGGSLAVVTDDDTPLHTVTP